ncbi:hypothetical protein MLD38_032483 [Melastoma candidum]|uniref:Uncharacterized protein n=1 Tax=Melastoma candidum TaxID=119954 RepID=A0ACB9M463_9MYRT|nr:hypothetical protein MLD38_032483 [Melastoma candidum]
MASCAWRQLVTTSTTGRVVVRHHPSPRSALWINNVHCCSSSHPLSSCGLHRRKRNECPASGYDPAFVAMATPGSKGIVPSQGDEDDDGISLGTMKLPPDTDLQRFESLLFQWANSLCQGANLPLPMPLKVDKVPGGARLGFITIGDGKTEVLVHIDCLVFPPEDGTSPIFRAIRNGPLKDQPPPGEPRIMRSLLQALQKSIQIARL